MIAAQQNIFEEMEKLSDYDVVIYSPTCKVGVSFELEHFDLEYFFTHPMSELSTEDSRQLIRRIRKIKEGKSRKKERKGEK